MLMLSENNLERNSSMFAHKILKHFIKPLTVDENSFLNDGQLYDFTYLNWFMLLYVEIPLISGGDATEIKCKNINDSDICPIVTMISD